MKPAKIIRFLEWAALFFGVPLLVAYDLLPFNRRYVLLIAAAACFAYLVWDKGFSLKRLCGVTKIRLIWKGMLIRTVLCAVLLTLVVWLFIPNMFFAFARINPKFWLIVMVLYPFLSAWPQEMLYRGFMFRRYAKVFGHNSYLMVAASSVAFSFLHIIYFNWIALVSTLAAGFIFSMDYKKTGYIGPSFIEHAIYGNLVFTVGLGYFFYIAM